MHLILGEDGDTVVEVVPTNLAFLLGVVLKTRGATDVDAASNCELLVSSPHW